MVIAVPIKIGKLHILAVYSNVYNIVNVFHISI